MTIDMLGIGFLLVFIGVFCHSAYRIGKADARQELQMRALKRGLRLEFALLMMSDHDWNGE